MLCASCDEDKDNLIFDEGGDSENIAPADPGEPMVEIPGDVSGEFVAPTGPVEALSSELRPILTEGKVWYTECYWTKDNPKIYPRKKGVIGDTVVNGFAAKKIAIDDVFRYEVYASKCFYAEKDGVLYDWSQIELRDPISGNYYWHEQCNMNCDKDYRISTPHDDYRVPLSRGTIVLMGKTRRAIKVWCLDWSARPAYIDYWVEGIGQILMCDPVNYDSTKPTNMYSRHRSRLLQCYDGDEKIYDCREFSHDLYVEEEILNEQPEEF